ncbi:unnamed protein product [Paramecium primaurelia]|uniref:Uncharacterized protein n=1 Tax=Paramecium primaurelia TaxID=5886 RepID=A0A8S1QUF4_PARPR|nr:unnamed protein product [Paramecium primaurelia]
MVEKLIDIMHHNFNRPKVLDITIIKEQHNQDELLQKFSNNQSQFPQLTQSFDAIYHFCSQRQYDTQKYIVKKKQRVDENILEIVNKVTYIQCSHQISKDLWQSFISKLFINCYQKQAPNAQYKAQKQFSSKFQTPQQSLKKQYKISKFRKGFKHNHKQLSQKQSKTNLNEEKYLNFIISLYIQLFNCEIDGISKERILSFEVDSQQINSQILSTSIQKEKIKNILDGSRVIVFIEKIVTICNVIDTFNQKKSALQIWRRILGCSYRRIRWDWQRILYLIGKIEIQYCHNRQKCQQDGLSLFRIIRFWSSNQIYCS